MKYLNSRTQRIAAMLLAATLPIAAFARGPDTMQPVLH